MTERIKDQLAADLSIAQNRQYSLYAVARAIAFDPGFRTLAIYRVSARLLGSGRWFSGFGYVIWQLGILLSSCHISPRAKIAGGVLLPHPTGVVIGDGVEIETGVVIFQNVTLGRRSMNSSGYPKLMTGAIVYAGAVIVGNVSVGRGAVVGANAFVAKDVANGARVMCPSSELSQ